MSASEAMAIAPATPLSRSGMREAGAAARAGGEPFARFLASTGHRVLRGAGAYWYDASPRLLPQPALAPAAAAERRGLRALLRHQPCAGVRFPAPLEGPGKLSYQIVCDDRATVSTA